jgi:hypothetical protein
VRDGRGGDSAVTFAEEKVVGVFFETPSPGHVSPGEGKSDWCPRFAVASQKIIWVTTSGTQ